MCPVWCILTGLSPYPKPKDQQNPNIRPFPAFICPVLFAGSDTEILPFDAPVGYRSFQKLDV